MKVTLKMPDKVRPSSTWKMPKDEWFDLESVTAREWMNIECKLPDDESIKETINWRFEYSSLSEQEKKYLYCISPNIEYSYINMPSNENDFLLPHETMFNEPCIIISFHEYILQYPKILRNILKIAEKPCYYLKNTPVEKYYRKELYCDSFGKWPYKNEKTCIIIRIVDSEANLRHQIVVPRKDNNHLFNLK
jgi:hypothetical protein